MTSESERKRVHLSAAQKRKALIEVARGKNPKEVLVNKTNSRDKKYSSKILHKWKKEAFSKKPDMQLMDNGNVLSDIDIEYELSAFNFVFSGSDFYKSFKKENIKYEKDSFIIFSNKYLAYKNLIK